MATATTTATAPRSVCHDDRGNAFAAGDLLMSHHGARAKRHGSSECRDYIRHHIKLIGCRHRHDQIGPARATCAGDGNHGRHAGHPCLGKHPACQRLNVGSGRPRYGLSNAETRPLPTSRGQHLLPGQRNAELDDPEQQHDQDGKQEGKLNGSGAALVHTAWQWRPPVSEPAVGARRSARQIAAESHPSILTCIPNEVPVHSRQWRSFSTCPSSGGLRITRSVYGCTSSGNGGIAAPVASFIPGGGCGGATIPPSCERSNVLR